jgi:hypothetical protein
MPTWDQDFDVYMAMMDDKPASFLIDLAAGGEAPVETHPVRLVIAVPLLRPRPDGLRDGSELDAMGKLEDDFASALEREVDAIFVGHVIHGGETTMYFYVPAEHRARLDALPELTGPAGDYAPSWGVEDDAAWECYRDFLSPDEYARQSIWNRRLQKVFAEGGDLMDVPREIDHFAYFATREQAEQAAEALRAAGFDTDDVEPPDPADTDDAANGDDAGIPPWSLQFHRADAVAGARPDEFCAEILDIILPLEGSYDGWGAPHVKAEGEA